MIFAIDFDGTIVENKWPDIGEPKQNVVDYIRHLQNIGHKWILWTCRSEEELPAVLKWCEEHGLYPDYVNDNAAESVERWKTNPRKVSADVYIDDHNAGGLCLPPLTCHEVDPTTKEQKMSDKKYPTIYSFDFDGTIVEKGKFPEFGKPVLKVVAYIKKIQERGDDWILNTNRDGKHLDDAVAWLEKHGLHPGAVNDNLPRMKEFFGSNPRKIFANVYIDDLNAGGVYLPPVNGCMDFGTAIRMLKDGAKIARRGWHGRNQFIFLADAVDFHTFADLSDSQDVLKTHGMIVLKTSDNTFQPGWMAKQADLLAEDWFVVK